MAGRLAGPGDDVGDLAGQRPVGEDAPEFKDLDVGGGGAIVLEHLGADARLPAIDRQGHFGHGSRPLFGGASEGTRGPDHHTDPL
ncbi:MAG: hypothetical protein L0H40_00240 [Micrococcaceae bacterium]|nr:hypothetical protein [Micrococcaceae bacterium]